MLALNDGSGVGGDTRPEVGALLSHGAGHGRSLHLTLIVHDHTCIVLEVQECSLLTPDGLSLTHHHSGVHSLSKLGLSLLARSHDEISGSSGGKSVLTALHTPDGDNLQGLAPVLSAQLSTAPTGRPASEERASVGEEERGEMTMVWRGGRGREWRG